VGEDGDARRAAPLVVAGELRGIEVSVDGTFGRRAPLHLRDDGELAVGGIVTEPVGESPRRRQGSGDLEEGGHRAMVVGRSCPVGGDDAVEIRRRHRTLPRSNPMASSVRATTRIPTRNSENTQNPSRGPDSNNIPNRNDSAADATQASVAS